MLPPYVDVEEKSFKTYSDLYTFLEGEERGYKTAELVHLTKPGILGKKKLDPSLYWSPDDGYTPFGKDMTIVGLQRFLGAASPGLLGVLGSLRSSSTSSAVLGNVLDDDAVLSRLDRYAFGGSENWEVCVSRAYSRFPNLSVAKILPSFVTSSYDFGSYYNRRLAVGFHARSFDVNGVPMQAGYIFSNSEAGDASLRISKYLRIENAAGSLAVMIDRNNGWRRVHRGNKVREDVMAHVAKLHREMDITGLRFRVQAAMDAHLNLQLVDSADALVKKLSAKISAKVAEEVVSPLLMVQDTSNACSELWERTVFDLARSISLYASSNCGVGNERESLEKLAFFVLVNPDKFCVEQDDVVALTI